MKYAPLFILLSLSGCAGTDKVLFVTQTSISIMDVDTAPANLSIGYDRLEGYLAPRYSNGALPPVVASINSNADIINPKVSQLYATGNAALVVGGIDPNDIKEPTDMVVTSNPNEKKLMFFGTSTNIGLKVGTLNNIPNSINFGYKRKEFSVIPLAQYKTDNKTVDIYPSVLASIENNTRTGINSNSSLNASGVGLENQQFFATGKAAVDLASILRPTFINKAKETVGQKGAAADVFKCYAGTNYNHKEILWEDAHRLNLFHEKQEERGVILKALKNKRAEAIQALEFGNIDTYLNINAKADSIYASSLSIVDEENKERAEDLYAHKELACQLSRMNQQGGIPNA